MLYNVLILVVDITSWSLLYNLLILEKFAPKQIFFARGDFTPFNSKSFISETTSFHYSSPRIPKLYKFWTYVFGKWGQKKRLNGTSILMFGPFEIETHIFGKNYFELIFHEILLKKIDFWPHHAGKYLEAKFGFFCKSASLTPLKLGFSDLNREQVKRCNLKTLRSKITYYLLKLLKDVSIRCEKSQILLLSTFNQCEVSF